MPVVNCPIDDCEYATPDVEAVLAAALLTTHAYIHNTGATNTATAKVENVKRPTISSAGTSEDWSYFTSRWNDYVAATKVSGKDKVIQLLECCDELLHKDLTRTAGGTLTNKTEEDVLKAIKTLAVREENTMVARVALHNMCQDRDEPIRDEPNIIMANMTFHRHGRMLRCGFCKTGEETSEVCGSLHTDTLNGKQITAHHKCMQYSAMLVQFKTEGFGGFRIHEVQKELNRGRYLKCEVCKADRVKKDRLNGATSGCAVDICHKTFHYHCVAKHPDTVAKRYRVSHGKKVVILYRVFCSKDHEKYYRSHIAEINENSSGSEVDSDDVDDDDSDRDDPSPDRDSSSDATTNRDSDVSLPKVRRKSMKREVVKVDAVSPVSPTPMSPMEMSAQEVVSCMEPEINENSSGSEVDSDDVDDDDSDRDDPSPDRDSSSDVTTNIDSDVSLPKVRRKSTKREVVKVDAVAPVSPTPVSPMPMPPMEMITQEAVSCMEHEYIRPLAMVGSSVTHTNTDNNITPAKKRKIDASDTIAMSTDDSCDNLTDDFNTSNSAGYGSDTELEDVGQDNWTHIIASCLEFDARDMKRACAQLKVPREKAMLWSSTCKPDGLTDDHLPFIMWDIANMLHKKDTSGLFAVLCEPSVRQYDLVVRFHTMAGDLDKTHAATFHSIRRLLDQGNRKLRQEAGRLVQLGGGGTHVLAVSLSESIDRNHAILAKIQEQVYEWSRNTRLPDSWLTSPNASSQSKLITDWLLTKVKNNFELERFPKEQTLYSRGVAARQTSVSELVAVAMETASQTVLTMASAKVLILYRVDRQVVHYHTYIQKLLHDFVILNDGFDCFFVFDVDPEDTGFQSLQGIVSNGLWSCVTRVYSAYNPSHTAVSCLVIHCPTSTAESDSQN